MGCEKMATATIKCPNCGGGLSFNPDSQKSKCEYCLSEFSNLELSAITNAIEEKAPLLGYVCNSCGAEVVTDETTSATFCYYCHNPVLLTERLTGEFKPTRIIPFTFDKEKATASFLKWSKTKRFVPKEFYSASQLEKITGMYIPYWMADLKADIDYSGTGTKLRVWRAGNMEYTESKEYRIERQGTVDIDHVHEVAMHKINKGLINSISPYDESKAVPFSMNYLSGFFAEKYDIQKQEVQPAIEFRARQYVSILVQEEIGSYERVSLDRSGLELSIKDWDYALLPAWILTYLYQGKTFVYAVNGQTGKAYGELPVDNRKLGLTSGIIAAIILILAVVGGFFLW
jgi:DNA-directed RNA polymerase subunit RPC12/RpoP